MATVVSHSNAESEVMSLDADLRREGIQALQLRDCVLETFSLSKTEGNLKREGKKHTSQLHPDNYTPFGMIDHVPSNIPDSPFPSK